MPHGNVRRSGRGRLPAERSMCLASARTGLAGGKPKMNTTPGNHRVGQEIRMGHVGAALRSTSWRPTGPHDVTELPALRRIQIHLCVRVRLASSFIQRAGNSFSPGRKGPAELRSAAPTAPMHIYRRSLPGLLLGNLA